MNCVIIVYSILIHVNYVISLFTFLWKVADVFSFLLLLLTNRLDGWYRKRVVVNMSLTMNGYSVTNVANGGYCHVGLMLQVCLQNGLCLFILICTIYIYAKHFHFANGFMKLYFFDYFFFSSVSPVVNDLSIDFTLSPIDINNHNCCYTTH